MKLDYLELCGFRGFRDRFRIEFADDFTVIDGRNGVGKSTIFDAVEFVLTGELSKYREATASGESVADYIWWKGGGHPPSDRYVEIGFRDGDKRIGLRRKQFGQPAEEVMRAVATGLCDPLLSPATPLKQLCSASIIRDEHITSLSLDLKETDRYALLRNALGATDASDWMGLGAKLISDAKKRTNAAQQEVGLANADLASATRRLDEVRASLSSEAAIGEATARLQEYLGSKIAADQLAGPARERIAEQIAEAQTLEDFAAQLAKVRDEEQRIPALSDAAAASRKAVDEASAELRKLSPPAEREAITATAGEARDLISLFSLGSKLGLREGLCPLCEAPHSITQFDAALRRLEGLAHRIDREAAQAAERQRASQAAAHRVALAERTAQDAANALQSAHQVMSSATVQAVALGLEKGVQERDIGPRIKAVRSRTDGAQRDLRILETLRSNETLGRAQKAESDARSRVAKAQDRFGTARKVESGAQALHDASRRAASETLDGRLERVLPLMSELYRRLRPHPVWDDIEYSIRGDVRRFLKLQVGADLNPQFLFSSGQRRATGLAFLLSVNLSLAWSRWRTILLDDPVQHVDDFRSVHLAELLAQVVTSGRQVICAVEDVALADMLARRLPVKDERSAKRVSLGPDLAGTLSTLEDRFLSPHERRALVFEEQESGRAA